MGTGTGEMIIVPQEASRERRVKLGKMGSGLWEPYSSQRHSALSPGLKGTIPVCPSAPHPQE